MTANESSMTASFDTPTATGAFVAPVRRRGFDTGRVFALTSLALSIGHAPCSRGHRIESGDFIERSECWNIETRFIE